LSAFDETSGVPGRTVSAPVAFEDLQPGASFDLGSVTVDRDDMIDFARRFDPQPYHLEEEAGHQSILGGLAASGWYTASLWMRAYADGILARSTSQASPGGTVSWLAPVFAGDVLSFRIEVTDARRSRSKPNLGIVEIVGTASREGTAVMRYTFVGFFGTRERG
jgi:acyl dehydratase